MRSRNLNFTFVVLLAGLCVGLAWGAAYPVGPLQTAQLEGAGQVEVAFLWSAVIWQVTDCDADTLQLQVADSEGETVYDSGLIAGPTVEWSYPTEAFDEESGPYAYALNVWDSQGQSYGFQGGEVRFADGQPLVQMMSYDVTGNFTISGSLGVGTDNPLRAVHLRGPNAVFRMDRSQDTAAFIIARTDASSNNVLKAFSVGVNATALNAGEFIVNDLGQNATGAGTRRMTIDNSGNAIFTGAVKAKSFTQTSSIRFKEAVQPLEGALDKILRLQGVRFCWKDTGEAALGLIAEDVGQVIPELVAWGADGVTAEGVDYSKLSAVLVEAAKTQDAEIRRLSADYLSMSAQVQELARQIKPGQK